MAKGEAIEKQEQPEDLHLTGHKFLLQIDDCNVLKKIVTYINNKLYNRWYNNERK